ncbi:hypothetical protein EDD27_2024 [Nonomuraea polychroma]|uniref:Mce-associated membrane protein n=1 Tax=Nonomuraea polychroma TaxID=46176 RepID=A0A438M2B0_9ACTN|nr:hypothetical protein [Nonomuraea polychroma]RVX39663.1 hypothetical protein EDD27_2024 [Nonomuraea polychroma]
MTPKQDLVIPEQDLATSGQDLTDATGADEPATSPATEDVPDVAASAATDDDTRQADEGPDGKRPAASTAPDDTLPADTSAPPDDAPSDDGRPAERGDESQGGQPAGGGRGSRVGRVTRARIAGALAAMLVAAVAATAVLQWVAAGQAEDARAKLETERALRLEVSGAASAFSKALLSYDYRDLQTTRATLTAQATGDFLATYDTAFGGAMAQVIVKLKAVSQATVRKVYLADVDEATAHAIVVVDQQVNTSEAIRSVKDSHLKISLVKEKGIWKVHDVTVLGAASEDQYNLDGGDQKKD